MSAGITFGAARPMIATVVDNGISADDSRVQYRTDESQKEILDTLLPVNSMMTVDVVASGTTILLPKEMDNAIFVEVLGGASVNNQTDVAFGWYNIVNQFTFVDPSEAHDLPLVDQFLQPDPGDATILRRQYDFPGLTPNSTVRVTGAKRWLPIENDGTYLIVQNVPAIKEMIQAIEYAENNDPQNADLFRKRCLERLQSEVKKHQLDPINSLKRKAVYEADMVNYGVNTFGWTLARLAFELNGGLSMGKSELSRILEQSEMRIMDKIQAIGTLQEYDATVTGGLILAPKEVETIIATSFGCEPLNIKNIFARYHKNGRYWGGCAAELRDEGEITYANGDRRRQYRLNESSTQSCTLRFVGKLRWLKKNPSDPMIVKNFEGIRLMCTAILNQKAEKWQEANVAEQMAVAEVDKQISEYLSGQILTAPTNFGFGRSHHGLL
jgi:hypothetical protein